MPYQNVIWTMQVSGPLVRIPEVRLRSGVTTLASTWGLQVYCQDYRQSLLMVLASVSGLAALHAQQNAAARWPP